MHLLYGSIFLMNVSQLLFSCAFFLLKILYLHRSILAPFGVIFGMKRVFPVQLFRIPNFLEYNFRVVTVFDIYSSFHCTRIECMNCFISPCQRRLATAGYIEQAISLFFFFPTTPAI